MLMSVKLKTVVKSGKIQFAYTIDASSYDQIERKSSDLIASRTIGKRKMKLPQN